MSPSNLFGQPMLRLAARRALSSGAPLRVRTAPHALVRVLGGAHGGDVAFSTNMESDSATVAASDRLGNALDAAAAVSVEHAENGADFEVVGGAAGPSLAIAVPASFTILTRRAGQPSNISVAGWLEGGVSLTTERGSLTVGTVRGMLTTLETGEGDIAAEMIEGDARMSTGRGAVSIGKLQGKVLTASSGHGDISARAIYCLDTHLAARQGSIRLGFLHTERATLEVAGGEVRIDALDGGANVCAREGGSIHVQLSDGARQLELHADGDIDVLVPEHLAFSGEASAPSVECDASLRALISHESEAAGGLRMVRLARRGQTSAAGEAPRDEAQSGLPAGMPAVRASSARGVVRFRAHSWLDRFKARAPAE